MFISVFCITFIDFAKLKAVIYMERKKRYFLLTALLLSALALRSEVLTQNKGEKEAGAIFVKEIRYAENRV